MNREKLLAYMEQKGIDGFFIAKKENVRIYKRIYGVGFLPSDNKKGQAIL